MNEVLLLVTGVVSAAFIVAAWKLGREQLYSVIIVFLILIAAVGGKLVSYFGHETNTGNIFYASVFLATYFVIERYGKREGLFSIWVGVVCVLFFTVLAEVTAYLAGSGSSAQLDGALSTAFAPLSRIAFASLVAYAISQNVNVRLYLYLRSLGTWPQWARANAANGIAQAVDSVVFFTLAFGGVVLPSNFLDIAITGYIIKVVYMMVASPLLYLNKVEEEDGEEFSSVTVR
jgi:queuosine precursor transporter